MAIDKHCIQKKLKNIILPSGQNIVDADMIRALNIKGTHVRFILEVSAQDAVAMEPVRVAAQSAVASIAGVDSVSVILTAHYENTAQKPPPSLKIGRHPTADNNSLFIKGVKNIIAIASGKGGVGKSTVTSNLAVALARQNRRVGLLDADIHGPSQPCMMGVSQRPKSPDGKIIIPLRAHGVVVMSIGFMLKPNQAVIWRGPMLMGALQQMLQQVKWGQLDILLIDLPPGTGDVHLTLAQKTRVTGTIIVSTPQNVALNDARKAMDMLRRTNTPILGIIENMAYYCCANCGHEAHIFGQDGARIEAKKQKVPFLGALPLDSAVRKCGDSGIPIAAGNSPSGKIYAKIAATLIENGY